MKFWTHTRIDELICRWSAGETVEQIALAMGRARASITQKVLHLADAGRVELRPIVEPVVGSAQATKWTQARLDELREMFVSGERLETIAQAMECSDRTVRSYAQRMGLARSRCVVQSAKTEKPKKRSAWDGIRFEDASRQELRVDIARRQLAFFRMPDETRTTLKRFIVPWSLP